MYQNIQKIHRISAIVVSLFVLLHLINHALAGFGPTMHIEVMQLFRKIYQNPLSEFILILAILVQVGTGGYFLKQNKGLKRTRWGALQIYSGAYLLFFLLAHTSALIFYRLGLGIDTNFYFGAGPIVGAKYLPYFFIPYYFLAIFSFWTHIACVLRRVLLQKGKIALANNLAKGLMMIGAVLGIHILLAFSGIYFDFELPKEIQGLFGAF